MILIDTNVISDIVSNDPNWYDWSVARIEEASILGKLMIVDVIYAELAARYSRIEELNQMIDGMELVIAPMSRESLFLAAKAFQRYRASGGTRTGVLPDFFIGAHAAVVRVPLLTRDAKRYATYFPTVKLIAPGI
ncbi:type II toxin-antitoxin system VapC family toxin [Mesorhizobium sp. 1B3]|uniref:type II toxin-antitoxin system VapC family toxin n=1 Tax=Mesorhizobium sp. 1B3 TaxID=3243599 RepID=UPI003D976374